MNIPRYRLLFALLCALLLLCSVVQATNLEITVRDSIDNTSISQATVFVNGANYARTNNNGQVLVSHSGLSDQRIRVAMTGYDDWERTIARNVTSAYVNLTRKTLTLKVILVDSDTLGPVSGAKVNISAVNVTEGKYSDSTGSATFAVKAHYYYTIDVRAENYHPYSTTINVGAENKEVTYQLLSGKRFSVVVKDKDSRLPVSDAEIRIDGTPVGKTDSRGILITPVTRGNVYAFEIIAPGYQSHSESRTITDADAIYNVEIAKAAIGAFIYVYDTKQTPLSGADIYFNGTLTGTTNEYGRSNFPSLVAGTYLVEVRKTGFVPISRTIIVAAEPADNTFTMEFENAALSVYVLDKDRVNVQDAQILVNGKVAGKTDTRGQLVTQVKFNTPLNITVSKEGYTSAMIMEEVVQGNATASVNVTLEKSLDLGIFIIIGAGILVLVLIIIVLKNLGGRRRRHVLRRDEI